MSGGVTHTGARLVIPPAHPACSCEGAGLVETVLHRTLPKPKDVRLGDWDTWPLKPIQQRYAAMVSCLCFNSVR